MSISAIGSPERVMESLVAAYTSNLREVLARAQARSFARLQRDIDQDGNGNVTLTPSNQALLRNVDKVFLDDLKESGFDSLVTGFVRTFSSQIPAFQESVDLVTSRFRTPVPKLTFSATDMKIFDALSTNGAILLRSVVQRSALAAQQNAMLTVGGMSFRDLSDAMAKQWARTVPESETMAATALSTYYRTLNARATDKIEASLPPSMALAYKPFGPLDRLTRPFCRKLLESGKVYRRREIDRMSNGQLSNVFLTFGGRRCRHQWLVEGLVPEAE